MLKTNTLKKFDFKQTITKRLTPKYREEKETIKSQIDSTNIHYTNTFKGNKLSHFDKDCIRVFYLNINGINVTQGDYSLVQLCLNLQEPGVVIISLIETHVQWKRYFIK